jgi:hypothetical protein
MYSDTKHPYGKDFRGVDLEPGQLVIRAVSFGRSPGLAYSTVRELRDGKWYLNDSKVPLQFTSRLIVVKDKL